MVTKPKEETAVVTSSPQPARAYSVLSKKMVVIVAVVLVVAIGAGIVVSMSMNRGNPDTLSRADQNVAQASQAKIKSMIPASAGTQKIEAEAEILWSENDVAGAQSLLNKAVASTNNKVDKGSLYETKARYAANSADALVFAKQAEASNPTVGSASLVAENAGEVGDKQLAIEYYKKQITRVDPSIAQAVVPTLQKKITDLGGQL